jgi:hypothetical protein
MYKKWILFLELPIRFRQTLNTSPIKMDSLLIKVWDLPKPTFSILTPEERHLYKVIYPIFKMRVGFQIRQIRVMRETYSSRRTLKLILIKTVVSLHHLKVLQRIRMSKINNSQIIMKIKHNNWWCMKIRIDQFELWIQRAIWS